jgi:hypothetical protein
MPSPPGASDSGRPPITTDDDAELQALRSLLEPRLDNWIQVAADTDLSEWGMACRRMKQALAGPASLYKLTLLGMAVGWHSRDSDIRRLGRDLLNKRRKPREHGHLKEGATKEDPAEVRAFYENLLAQGQPRAAARTTVMKEFGISRWTLGRWLKKPRNTR